MKPDLEAIRARAEKATAGPWENDGWGDVIAKWDKNLYGHIASKHRLDGRNENMDFIAHARADIPTLLAYIDSLERVREALMAKVNEWRVNAARETKSSMTGFPESQAADSARADVYESCADELAALAATENK